MGLRPKGMNWNDQVALQDHQPVSAPEQGIATELATIGYGCMYYDESGLMVTWNPRGARGQQGQMSVWSLVGVGGCTMQC